MKNRLTTVGLITIAFFFSHCKSGLVTTSNSCYNLISSAQSQNKSGNYSAALDNFNTVLKKCDAYDAKEKGYAGKAAALNGLKQYNDALEAANQGLKINKNSLDNLFEKASAELGLGMDADAKAEFNTILGLTEKNRNTAQRATIYAKMAEIDTRQHMYNDALNNIQQAINTDNSNTSFYIQRGDINTAAGNLSAAVDNYDEAIAKDGSNTTAWRAKTNAVIRLYQKKYATNDAGVLGRKISTADRQTLCGSIRGSQQKGVKDAAIDLVQLSVCK